MPSIKNGAKLSVRPDATKAAEWTLLLRQYMSAGEISRADLDKLVGRFSLARSAIFGRFSRALMAPMCRNLYAFQYSDAIAAEGITILRSRRRFLGDFSMRQGSSGYRGADFITYADVRWGDDKGSIESRLFGSKDFRFPLFDRGPPTHRPQAD